MKFEYYTTIRWTTAERKAQGHAATRVQEFLRYIKNDLCKEFCLHLDLYPELNTVNLVVPRYCVNLKTQTL